ncbi:hypothetical protein PROFUN_02862 [Planoprotostelium fungivorum]|uniref:HP domain-containing protein n=1 Tax=Planoprotostelium fungivorum TaxID=1890364 RepID=A0A2P6NRW1_9EUKA|nr:hypothetical protein PROFUN_02862 [Planoprotostelium fungivorum]
MSASAATTPRSKTTSGLFGSPIDSVLLVQEAANPDLSNTIPFIVKDILAILSKKKHLLTENLFRQASDKTKVKQLKNEYEKAFRSGALSQGVDLDKWATDDVHTISAVLKLYLFYLPQSLLLPSPTGSAVQKIVEELSIHSRDLLNALLYYFSALTSLASANKVSVSIICKIFGPILLPPGKDPSPTHAKTAEAVLKSLLEKRGDKGGDVKSKPKEKVSMSDREVDPDKSSATPTKTTTTTTTPSRVSSKVLSPPTPSTTTTSPNSRSDSEKKESATLQNQIKVLTTKLAERDKALDLAKKNNETGTKRLKELESKISETEKMIRAAESAQGILQDQLRIKEKKINDQEKTIENMKESEKLKNARSQQETDRQNNQQAAQIATLNQQSKELQATLDAKQAANDKFLKEMAAVKEAVARASQKLQNQQKTNQDLRDAIKQMQEENGPIVSLKQQMAELDARYREEQLLRKKYYNMYIQEKGNIRVYGRIRPLSSTGFGNAAKESVVASTVDEYTIRIDGDKQPKMFDYDKMFAPDTSQEQIFDDVGDMVQSAADGYNVCIFAYGQTGSGKTHTMMGYDTSPGIIPRAARKLFDLLEAGKSTTQYKVSCCMMELYNDELLDLFSKEDLKKQINTWVTSEILSHTNRRAGDKLNITKDARGIVIVQNIVSKDCHSAQELLQLIKTGSSNRHVESTNMNEHSSRSHLLIALYIETRSIKSPSQEYTLGKLTLVDLAGSERVGKSGATDVRLKEAQSINKSLAAIGHVISALSSGEAHIPYRNNKLTMLLSDSIGGNAKTLMMVCVSPAFSNRDETLNSLAYAQRIRSVTNRATKNASGLKSPDASSSRESSTPGTPVTRSVEVDDFKKMTADRKAFDDSNSSTSTSMTSSPELSFTDSPDMRHLSMSPKLPSRPTIANRRAATKDALKNKAKIEADSASIVAENQAAMGAKSPAAIPLSAAATPTRTNSTPNIMVRTMPKGAGNTLLAQALKQTTIEGVNLRASTGSIPTSVSSVPLDFFMDEKQKKLIRVIGRRGTRVETVVYAASTVSEECVFILDLFDKIIVWNGSKANRIEKAKAVDVASRMKHKERKSRAEVINIDGPDKAAAEAEFWKALGGKPSKIAENPPVEEPDTMDYLYVWEKDGQIDYTPVGVGKLQREMIEADKCYILDSGNEVYVWQGQKAPLKFKKESVLLCQKLMKSNASRPSWVKPFKVLEGGETILFKEKFTNWPDVLPIQMASTPRGNISVTKHEDRPLDVNAMFNNKKPEVTRVVFDGDNGSGKKTIWMIKEFGKTEVPQAEWGIFRSSESYIILYTYMVRNREVNVLYFWQGRDSSVSEKGTSAYLTVNVGEEITNGGATQVRVVQNQETPHFLSVFKDRFIVVNSVSKSHNPSIPCWKLFHVSARATQSQYYPIQMPFVTPLGLCSLDCFLIMNETECKLWKGSAASNEKVEAARRATKFIPGILNVTEIKEKEEDASFWKALGGELPAGSPKYSTMSKNSLAKLFQCSNASGTFKAEEVFDFCQDNLEDNDMAILDTGGPRLYVWVGKKANEEKQKKTLETANNYQKLIIEKRGSCRSEVVKSGKEPPDFTACFHGWDHTKTSLSNEPFQTVDEVFAEYSKTYTIEELRTKPAKLDSRNLEKYLSTEDFVKYFKMTQAEFQKQLSWKQENTKKALGLY